MSASAPGVRAAKTLCPTAWTASASRSLTDRPSARETPRSGATSATSRRARAVGQTSARRKYRPARPSPPTGVVRRSEQPDDPALGSRPDQPDRRDPAVHGPGAAPSPDNRSVQLAIEACGLRKSYGGRSVVDGLELEVAAGQCFALLGPNGA